MTRILLAILALALTSPAHAVECFDSVKELLAANPHPIHYSWTHGRYYVGHPQKHVKCDVRTSERKVMPDEQEGLSPAVANRRTPESRPPSATGAVSPPDWIVVKTEPAKWPEEIRFDPPPLSMTAEHVEAAPVEDEPQESLRAAVFGTGGRMVLVGTFAMWWGRRSLRRKA